MGAGGVTRREIDRVRSLLTERLAPESLSFDGPGGPGSPGEQRDQCQTRESSGRSSNPILHLHNVSQLRQLRKLGGIHTNPRGSDGTIYAGILRHHDCAFEQLAVLDARQATLSWSFAEIPDHVRVPDKAIDSLHTDGNRLIAIDNLVKPKFIFTYDVTDPTNPVLEKTHACERRRATSGLKPARSVTVGWQSRARE